MKEVNILSYCPSRKPLNCFILVVISALFILLSPSSLRATGGLPGSFLSWGAGARSMGMGKAFVSVADDASATYWNPAGLYQIERSEVVTLYSKLWIDSVYQFASFVYPTIDMGAFGASFVRMSTGGFEETNENNEVIASFSDEQLALVGSYGRKIINLLALGINAKYISHSLGRYTDSSFSLDTGVIVDQPLVEKLKIGLNLQNLVSFRASGDSEDTLPLNIRLGTSYRMIHDRLTLSFDLDTAYWKTNRGRKVTDLNWHLGVEYWAMSLASLRFGLDKEETTAGLSARWKDYQVDYAFALHNELGFSHRMAASVKFGPAIIITREEMVRTYFNSGQKAYESGLYIKAMEEFEKSLALYPADTRTQKMVNKLRIICDTLHIDKETETRANTYYQKSLDYFKQSKWYEARELIKEALKLNPFSSDSQKLLEKVEKLILSQQ